MVQTSVVLFISIYIASGTIFYHINDIGKYFFIKEIKRHMNEVEQMMPKYIYK